MCIIAIKKKGYPLPDESIFQTMFKNNPDGAGFCYTYNGKVIIQKGYMSFKSFQEALKRVSENIDTYHSPMMFHFRIATHGGIKPALCHPFPLSKKIPNLKCLYIQSDLAIVHNGVIPIDTKEAVSDTMEYIRTNLTKRTNTNPEFYKNKKQRKTILAEINNSRMAFLDCKGNVYTIGEFITDNGIMYSNSSYKERTLSFNFFDDYLSYVLASPLDEGYITSNGNIFECEYGQYFIDRCGRIYEYDYAFDVAFRIRGTAYNENGLPLSFDTDNAIRINVIL